MVADVVLHNGTFITLEDEQPEATILAIKDGRIAWLGDGTTALEALKMYTINAAYACYREHELGSLKVGKLADIVVLPENILSCNPKELVTMKIKQVLINGTLT